MVVKSGIWRFVIVIGSVRVVENLMLIDFEMVVLLIKEWNFENCDIKNECLLVF